MNAPAKVAACDMGYEELLTGLDAFYRRPGHALREVVMRPMLDGVLVRLIENGDVYEGRGRLVEDALARALEALEEAT